MASSKLVKLARAAARAEQRAMVANAAWIEAFRAEYGHDDIDDILVEVIDCGHGDPNDITSDFIDAHSNSGKS